MEKIFDKRLEKTMFELIDKIPTKDLKEGFEALSAVDDDWILRLAILSLVPDGQIKLRKYNFLERVPAEQIRIVFEQYILDIEADEKLQEMF